MKELGNQLWQMCARPISKFLGEGVLGGVLLILGTLIALFLANSPYHESYESLLHIPLRFSVGEFGYDDSLQHFINDGLMVIFFFVVGLEIKRELLVGELSTVKKALLPAIAALGGMIVPASLYVLFNLGGEFAAGWGIPMATDIAFALGVMAILGNRVPFSLKVFLLALAIFDDMGAILVIAVFYGEPLNWTSLLIGLILLLSSVVLNVLGVRKTLPYAILGLGLWFALLNSGIHATIAGVLLALTIPARSKMDQKIFKNKTGDLIRDFPDTPVDIMVIDENQREYMKKIQCSVNDLDSPLQRLEDSLHEVSNFIILPIFAFANAGVQFLGGGESLSLLHPISLGILAGLVIGKPIGIFLSVMLANALGITNMPEGVSNLQLLGIGCLGGIGFTMSIFITNLAFVDTIAQSQAKFAILMASLLSSVIGIVLLAKTAHR